MTQLDKEKLRADHRRTHTIFCLLLLVAAPPLQAVCDPPADTTPDPFLDFNCDGRVAAHCGGIYGPLDLYHNALVTGFSVNPDGTYFLVGDENLDANGNGIADFREADDIPEDFFQFLDIAGSNDCLGGSNAGMPCDTANGNADCPFSVCGSQDGTVRFDPSLAGTVITDAGEYADPRDCDGSGACDRIFYVPTGNATGSENGDGQAESPNCDRTRRDQQEGCGLYFLDASTVRSGDTVYNGSVELVRGAISELTVYPEGVDLGQVNCVWTERPPATFLLDEEPPASGEVFFYVTRIDNGSVYPYGYSHCRERIVSQGNGSCTEP
jgi:hypothetical protein